MQGLVINQLYVWDITVCDTSMEDGQTKAKCHILVSCLYDSEARTDDCHDASLEDTSNGTRVHTRQAADQSGER